MHLQCRPDHNATFYRLSHAPLMGGSDPGSGEGAALRPLFPGLIGQTRFVMNALRTVLISVIAIAVMVAQEAPEGIIPLMNARCIDGQPVDARLETVLVRVHETTYAIRVSSRENAEAIRKMRPEAALRAVIAFNDRSVSDRVVNTAKTP